MEINKSGFTSSLPLTFIRKYLRYRGLCNEGVNLDLTNSFEVRGCPDYHRTRLDSIPTNVIVVHIKEFY